MEAGLIARLVVASLAVWRVSHMLAFEDGPGEVFFKLRLFSGATTERHVYPGGEEEVVLRVSGFWSSLLTCPLCTSVWLAAPAALWVAGLTPDALVVWLAVSGLSSVVELATQKG